MTNEREPTAAGTIFSVGMNGTNYQNLASFTGTGGHGQRLTYPRGGLLASGSAAARHDDQTALLRHSPAIGNVFSVGTDGTSYHNLLSFTGTGGTASGWRSPKAA